MKSKSICTGKESYIMLRKKPYIERDKALAERHLVARLETLKSKGMTDVQIQRDATARHFKGEIRQAKYRLACIAELENLMARKAEIKAEKLAAPKVEQPRKRRAAGPIKQKIRAERKAVAVEAEEE